MVDVTRQTASRPHNVSVIHSALCQETAAKTSLISASQVRFVVPRISNAAVVHLGNKHKIGHCSTMQAYAYAYAVLMENISITFISYKSETAMTPQDHVTTSK